MNDISEKNRKRIFEARTKQQILVCKNLITGLEMVKNQLPDFDNKVVNVRILRKIKELENPLKLTFSLKHCNLKIFDGYHRTYQKNEFTIEYLHDVSVCINIVTTNGKFNYEESVRVIDEQIKCLNDRIHDLITDLKLYEQEKEEWYKLEIAVNCYKDKYSSDLRGEIDMKRNYYY